MKNYRQLINELPSRKVVLTFGRFQPPSVGHELLVNAVKKIAFAQRADHLILASTNQDKKINPLIMERKLYYLNRMFPKTNFALFEENLVDILHNLKNKYKNICIVTSEDQVSEYKKTLSDIKVNSASVIAVTEKDPDCELAPGMNCFKMRESAKKGLFEAFKNGLPLTLTELDGKRLMNEVRQGMGLDTIKQQVKFDRDELREKYFAGEIFNVGDIVECENILYKIVKRGSNHLLVQDKHGNLVGKWPKDLIMTEEQQWSDYGRVS